MSDPRKTAYKSAPGEAHSSHRWTAYGLLTAAVVAAYANAFAGVFVYDDMPAIVDNPTLRSLLGAFSPPRDSGLPVSGRPLVNFSLALNFAVGGLNPWGYHLVNVAIHLGAVFTLFALTRRTLELPACRPQRRADAIVIAATAALVWAVHPLQTESVTYIVQRAESLMALFYLLTLYAVTRAITQPAMATWRWAAVLFCAAGMATKEVMVSAPVIALLYDRAFGAGSIKEAWRARRGLYSGLGLTWLILAAMVAQSGGRGGTAGFGTSVPWWAYALTQCEAIPHYLRLAFWPAPLVFDYGTGITTSPNPFSTTVLVLLVTATLVLLVKRPKAGFFGFAFFAVLAPTSSVVPIASEVMAEHRMYLPLAAVVTGLIAFLGRRSTALAGFCGLAAAIALGLTTRQRNNDYHSEIRLWTDTVVKAPRNPRAHFNLGELLAREGRWAEAIGANQRALALRSNFPSAHSNLSRAYGEVGNWAEAQKHAVMAIQQNAQLAEGHNNLGNALFQQGNLTGALAAYREAVRLNPQRPEFRNNLGAAHSQLGELAAARLEYEASLRLDPERPETHYFLGNIAARQRRFHDAVHLYEKALALRPDYVPARDNLARVRALVAPASGR